MHDHRTDGRPRTARGVGVGGRSVARIANLALIEKRTDKNIRKGQVSVRCGNIVKATIATLRQTIATID